MGRRLGQHFLKGTWAARTLVDTAGISSADTVLEIGPGKGALTKELLKTGARIIAIEKDETLVEELQETFSSELASKHLTVVSGDIRNFDPRVYGLQKGKYVLAANIPYYITGEIIRMFLENDTQPRTIALLVQKEVAQRVIATRESILSLSVKAYGTPRIAAKVPRGNFSPPPAVDSAILVIEHISKQFFSDISEEGFFKIVHAGFSSKRKLLSGNLVHQGYEKSKVLEAFAHCDIPEKSRAENISIEKWRALAKSLTAHK